MKDLVEMILKGLAGYLPVLISVVTKPKTSILSLIDDKPERLNKALIFTGLSIAIGFVFQAPLLQTGQDFVTIAGSMLTLKIIAILTFAGFIRLIFRLLGGKGDYETTLCACLYIISPIYLFFIVTNVINLGIITSHDPALALLWRSGQGLSAEQIADFVNLSPITAFVFLTMQLVQFTISTIWFLLCWGTYRSIHQVSRARSILAYLLMTVAWYAYWILTILILRGLHNGLLPPLA